MSRIYNTIHRFVPAGTSVLVLLLTTVVVHAQSQDTFYNPLDSHFSSVQGFIAGALLVMVKVALPFITLAFVYSGYLFISAQGKIDQLTKAKTNFLYTVVGALLILGAWELANLLGGTVSQITGPTN